MVYLPEDKPNRPALKTKKKSTAETSARPNLDGQPAPTTFHVQAEPAASRLNYVTHALLKLSQMMTLTNLCSAYSGRTQDDTLHGFCSLFSFGPPLKQVNTTVQKMQILKPCFQVTLPKQLF